MIHVVTPLIALLIDNDRTTLGRKDQRKANVSDAMLYFPRRM